MDYLNNSYYKNGYDSHNATIIYSSHTSNTSVSDNVSVTLGKSYMVITGATGAYITITYDDTAHQVTNYPTPNHSTFVFTPSSSTNVNVNISCYGTWSGYISYCYIIEI